MNAPHTILIVDDNDTARYVKARILRREGYRILEAGNGADALQISRVEQPSLVLLDVKLPDISGIAVCREIKRFNASILVLQTSVAFTSARDRSTALSGGADSYLVEPLEPEELIANVTALLRLHKAEQELRRANEQLEQKVAERTRQLADINGRLVAEISERAKAEEILRHTQKLDVLGRLTGGIAHDFNNLLMIILGNLETLRRQMERESPDRRRIMRAVENAFRGGQRAAALTQQLLAFARRQPLDPKPLSVNDLVSRMAEVIPRALGEEIVLDLDLSQEFCAVHADRNQLENALLNLAINARDAMPHGGKLTIRTRVGGLGPSEEMRTGLAPAAYAVIEVSDTGKGMTPDVITRAFEPFFTTKDVGHGTGLGLSQVYGFVTQSGGNVVIDSEVGKGTTVRIFLPCYALEKPTDIPPRKEQAPRGAGETVLVVEDDNDVRAHTAGVLMDLGYKIVEASTGPAALAVLQDRGDVAVVFTDIGLAGGLNGIEMAERARDIRPDVPVLFTTGYGLDSPAGASLTVAEDQLLRKPFSYAALATKLRNCLSADARMRAHK